MRSSDILDRLTETAVRVRNSGEWGELADTLVEAAAEVARLRLTDAERFVLREVRDTYADEDDVACNEIAAVLDWLLDRLG